MDRLRISKSKKEPLPIPVGDTNGINHGTSCFKLIKQGFHLQVLERLWLGTRRRKPDLLPKNWVLSQNNASSQTALSVKLLLANEQVGLQHV
jgi:hypothetical protein